MKKIHYQLTTIVTFLLISAIAIVLTINYINIKEKELLDKKYNNFAEKIKDKVESLILKKKNATLALTITLSSSSKVLDVLEGNEFSYNLKELSYLLREKTDFKNVWF